MSDGSTPSSSRRDDLITGAAVTIALLFALPVPTAGPTRDPHSGRPPLCGHDHTAIDAEWHIGATATTGAFGVTAHAFEDPVIQPDDLIDTVAGHRLVAVETTVTNTSSSRQSFSTMLLVELVDSLERTWSASVFGVSDRPGLDARVAPGVSRRGWVGFEVPADATGFRFSVKGNLAAEATTFSLL